VNLYIRLSQHGWFLKFIKFYYCDVLILLVPVPFFGGKFSQCVSKTVGENWNCSEKV
jgi:hypothetical protein